MYLLVRGTALEIQDSLAGKRPVMVDTFVEKKMWVADDPSQHPVETVVKVPVPTKYKVTSVTNVYDLIRLSDEVYVQAVDAEATEWVDEEGSSSDSGSEA